jgi:hypothetical protein
MFSLHETTQRRVCRVAFVVCALAPALLTVVWSAYSLRPWRAADWRRTLSQQLHVQSTVEGVTSPRPGIQRLAKVRLADLRTELPLATLDDVRVQWQGSRLMLVAQHLEIEAESFSATAATLATWMSATMSATDLPAIELRADRLTIFGGGQQTLSLHNLIMVNERQKDQSQQVVFQAMLPAAGQGGAALPLRLVVEQRGKQTKATLQTGAAQAPSWLLASLLPGVARCAEATFTGSVQLESDARQTRGSMQGRLAGLTLRDWLGPDSPHTIRGTAQVELEQLSWRGDRVVSARGSLQATRGAIGQSLLKEAVKRFYCVPGASFVVDANASEKLQPFDELACEFQISSAGITLTGNCSSLSNATLDATSGCLLAVDGRSLLMEPPYASLPVAQLVQVLSQGASSWLPASQEAHAMAGKLPLPSVGPQTKKEKEVATRPKDSSSQ